LLESLHFLQRKNHRKLDKIILQDLSLAGELHFEVGAFDGGLPVNELDESDISSVPGNHSRELMQCANLGLEMDSEANSVGHSRAGKFGTRGEWLSPRILSL